MSGKFVTIKDHAMLTLIVSNIFPLLENTDKVKWLRNTIARYHDWYSFFSHDNWGRSTIKNHHNYLVKLVTRKKNILAVVERNDVEYVNSRLRMSVELHFIKYMIGKKNQITIDDSGVLCNWVSSNIDSITTVLSSKDPDVRVHYYFILAMLYNKCMPNKDPVLPFYVFTDYIDNQIRNAKETSSRQCVV
jgi:hypothetical protein